MYKNKTAHASARTKIGVVYSVLQAAGGSTNEERKERALFQKQRNWDNNNQLKTEYNKWKRYDAQCREFT
jgi:hypothetical protein